VRPATGRYRVRWSIFAFLFAFAFIAYVQRTGVAIAAERMMPELGLSQVQIGWLLTAFLIGYTGFQLPGGVLGQRWGARWTLFSIGLIAFAATALTAGIPSFLSGTGLFLALLGARLILGVAQAPIFPVCSGAIESWFPVARWPFPQGILNAGLNLGSAATPPLIAALMQSAGWQFALVVTSVPALALIAWWAVYGRDAPAVHRSVERDELAELRFNPPAIAREDLSARRILRLLGRRDVLLLTTSYFLMNYVFYLLTFWSFLYLVQERHFSVLEGGCMAAIPFVAAALGSAAGGRINEKLCMRYGTRWGYRLLPLIFLPIGGACLLLAVSSTQAYAAVLALCLAFACIELTEGPFWAATMRVAPADAMAATGVLNTGGNLGGIVATPIVAALSAQGGWTVAFAMGATLAIASALVWLWIDPDRPPAVAAPKASGARAREPFTMLVRVDLESAGGGCLR
jgi:MFS transporter, ACS family, glucarate transporter